MIEGLQGVAGEPDWLHHQHVIATAKHFVGDGGTHLGKDQGDCVLPERKLAKVHGRAYAPAITAGVQVVMASYNSWQGVKLHGNAPLLTQVLRQRMQFDGVVVGDWNGHGQVAGCTNTSCPAALMAGVDMLMAPDSWKGLYANTLDQVNSGQIPLARVDEAVSRILRLKYRAKLFDAGLPSSRPTAGQFELLGQPAHRALARQAVQASLVLLKNERQTLPLRRGSHIVVTGDAANDSQQQAGGWSLSWQGADANPADFIGVTTIGQGLQQVAATHGATVELNPQGGLWQQRPDVAVVVFGEPPYAEYKGDRSTVAFEEAGNNLALLQQYQAQGIPTVAVFLSGRPLWVNPYLNAADAFVAAWLPGSEGQGVADVLFGDVDFKGQLSFSWPSSPHQSELNRGDDGYQPLFPYGYGLSYARPGHVGHLSEELPVADKH
jgi:beta-glucosidase